MTAKPTRPRRYWDVVDFIALNDEPSEMDPEEVEHQISTMTAAVATGVPAKTIAADVLALRMQEDCDECSGTGEYLVITDEDDESKDVLVTCPKCKGKGKIPG